MDNPPTNDKFHFNSLVDVQNHLKKQSPARRTKLQFNTFQASKINYLKAIVKFLVSSNTNVKTHYTYYGRSKFAVLIYTIFNTIKKRYREFFINKNLIRGINNKKPLIYFPLQVEPERTILIAAPNYTNQIEVITNIVKSLPSGYELYVKEHPASGVFREWRSVNDYKKIMELPNVKLVHPSVKSEDLIKKSSLVITISSSSGFEAAFYNKPSIIFSDLDYSILPSVHKIKAIDELPVAIKSSLKKEVKISDLNYYINLIEENSFELDFDSIDTDFYQNFHYGGFLADVEIPIEKMRLFLERHDADFDKIAAECIKKIQY
jgi:capsule polysaccharide modification protein KpsS